MATIPTYDDLQENPQPLPGSQHDLRAGAHNETHANPALFDAQGAQLEHLGLSAVKAGGDVLGIATNMQERQNLDMVSRQETATKAAYIPFETSVKQMRGQDAVGATTKAADWWDKQIQDGADNLENPEQKRAYKLRMRQLQVAAVGSVANHEADQRRVSVDDATRASIGSSTSMAAANADNMEIVNQSRADIINSTRALGASEGWKPERLAQEITQNTSRMHVQVIENMVDQSTEAARAYYTDVKGRTINGVPELDGAQHDKIDKLLKHSGALEEAQQKVDELSASAEPFSLADGLQQIREDLKGETRAHAETMWQQRFTEIRHEREALQKDAADSAWGFYAKNRKLTDIPAALWDKMDGKDRLAIQDRFEADSTGKVTKTDFAVWNTLNQMAISDPKQFLNTDLRRYSMGISTDDLKAFGKMQAEMVKDNGKGVAEVGTQLHIAHELQGWTQQDADKMGKFDSAAYAAMETARQAKGKDLTYEERQQIIDRMQIEGKAVGSRSKFLPDKSGKYYEFSGTNDAKNFKAEVPADERAKIEDALKRNGKPVTDDAVNDLYRKKYGMPSQEVVIPQRPKATAPTAPKADYAKPTVKPAPAASGASAAPIKPDNKTSYSDEEQGAMREDYMRKADAHMKAIDTLSKMRDDPNVKPGTVAKQEKETARLKALADEAYKKAHPKK